MLKFEKQRIRWGVSLSLSIISIPAIIYYFNFGRFGISDDPVQWAQFGDFMNIWISMASLILLALLTYEVYKSEESRENQQAKADRMKNSPILVFIYENQLAAEDLSYGSLSIKNSGTQAALNVSILSKYESFSKVEENRKNNLAATIKKIVTILPGEIIQLSTDEKNELGKYFTLYNDAHSNVVLTVMYEGFNYIIEDWNNILEKSKLHIEINDLVEYHKHRRNNMF